MGRAVHSYTFVNFCGLWTITYKSASVSRVPSPGTSLRSTGWHSVVLKQHHSRKRHSREITNPTTFGKPPLTWRTLSGFVLVSMPLSLGLPLSHDKIVRGISGARLGRSQMQVCVLLDWIFSAVIREPKQVGKQAGVQIVIRAVGFFYSVVSALSHPVCGKEEKN